MGIRFEYAPDLPRRVVFDDANPEDRWEEWRCARCHHWFPPAFVKLIAGRRGESGDWLVEAYCARCRRADRANAADTLPP